MEDGFVTLTVRNGEIGVSACSPGVIVSVMDFDREELYLVGEKGSVTKDYEVGEEVGILKSPHGAWDGQIGVVQSLSKLWIHVRPPGHDKGSFPFSYSEVAKKER